MIYVLVLNLIIKSINQQQKIKSKYNLVLLKVPNPNMEIKKQQQHLDYCVCLNTDVPYFIFVGQVQRSIIPC